MNRNHGNLNVALLPGLILAALAAGGWYYYYSELDKNQSLENNNESVQRELNQELEQQQNTIDRLTQTERELNQEAEQQQNTIDRLTQTERELNRELEQQQNTIDRLTQTERELNRQLEQQQNTIDQLTQTERELQASLALEIELEEQLQASFEAIKVEKEQLEISMQQEANRVASTTAELEKELQQRQARQKSLEDNISRVSGEKSQLTSELEQEQNKRQQLQQQIAKIVDDVGQKEKALANAEVDVSHLNQALETTRQEQNLLVADIEELNRQRNKDSEHFADLKRRLEQELDQSQVEIAQLKNQMMVIQLTDDVLFSSGSADIKADGKKVLSLIAESLNAYPDRAISIEGHTDHVPTGSNSRYASNWELSAMRALAAVNYFQQNSEVDPKRLKLVGYGEYRPVYSNITDEGRKGNRRIEIILLPPE